LIPFLLSEGKNPKKNAVFVLEFLSGRLLAYLLIGLLAGLLGSRFTPFTPWIIGLINICLAILLILYGFYRFKTVCPGTTRRNLRNTIGKHFPSLVPVLTGTITGINICPPLLLAVSNAVETGSIGGSLLFFAMFFIGTAVYFIPLPFIGAFRRQQTLSIIGKFAALLMGFIYLYKGIYLLLS
ncbi:MAG: sulfite exporter TauE/SafE family protein, partial [Bacteroidales bacterium]|nr:sulfite exporter TauE/SafE family protein [Bacteroidales bacterium]